MKVIPVIDVLKGAAVHGIRGQRNQYKPLKSTLFESTNPLTIASLFESSGFTSLYLADLDAILGKPINLNLFKQIAQRTNLDFMVDSAISDINRAQELLDAKVPKLVIGSETLETLSFVQQAVDLFGGKNVIVSVDQKNGKLLSNSNEISSLDVFSFLSKLVGFGATQVILLDLDRVGTGSGVDLWLIQKIMEKTEIDIFVGGGIRNFADLEELNSIGVSGALVASSLHDGTLSVVELKSAGFL